MKSVTIPQTDLMVSTVCLGSGEVGSSLNQEKSFALLDAMLEYGGNFLDTAHDYGNWVKDLERSASEKTIGRWQ
jgi:aryl-alcohol dehydrogenase-like predicted oxidoreductase